MTCNFILVTQPDRMIIDIITLLPILYILYLEFNAYDRSIDRREIQIYTSFLVHKNMEKIKLYTEQLLKSTRTRQKLDPAKPITAIRVIEFCRLGNNIITILNALSIATDLGIKKIYFHESYWFLNTSLIVDGFIFIKNRYQNEENMFRDTFYYPYKKISYNQSRTLHVLTKHFQSQIPQLNTSNEKLILHIRGGDIFSNFKFKNHAQPPFCFYYKVINIFKKDDVTVFAEDRVNPVVNELEKYGVNITQSDLLTTVSNIFYSKNIAFGYSTFASSICRISNIPKNIYVFGNMQFFIGFKDPRFKVFINNMTDEYKQIMYPWSFNNNQRECFLKCKCMDQWVQQRKEFINNDHRAIL